jgi:hypothetical protein
MPVRINPKKAMKIETILDPRLTGRISPYPTVVAVMKDQSKLVEA